jgi:hypothetical protein
MLFIERADEAAPMKIDSYSFGKIKINGTPYTSDVIIYPDHVDPTWWREEGHRLAVSDLGTVLKSKPEAIVIGTGYMGALLVPEETKSFLHTRGVRVLIERTRKAVELFNDLQQQKRQVIALLHLTC